MVQRRTKNCSGTFSVKEVDVQQSLLSCLVWVKDSCLNEAFCFQPSPDPL